MANWVMAELVRVFHAVPIAEAQALVESLAERRIPLVRQSGAMRRVLNPELAIKDQILHLASTSAGPVSIQDMFNWLDNGNKAYFNKMIQQLHKARCINYAKTAGTIEILPPGTSRAAEIARG
jgi:hypothetical protein